MPWYEAEGADKVRELLAPPPPGGSFPDFTGSGSPEGVITADVGKSYVDTMAGGLWVKRSGAGNTGWIGAVVPLVQSPPGSGDFAIPPGVSFNPTDEGGYDALYVAVAGGGYIQITDEAALVFNSSGNAIYWNPGGAADGAQEVLIELGPTGQFDTRFKADGSTEFPGPITGPTSLLPVGTTPAVAPGRVTGSFYGDYDWIAVPPGAHNDGVVLAYGLEGDAFPRVAIMGWPDDALCYFGNGTFDPTSGQSIQLNTETNRLQLPGKLLVNGDVQFTGSSYGPVIYDDTNGHSYRIGFHNGAPTYTQVT